MISVTEALQRVTSGVRPVGGEQVGLAQALGRVLATDVAARVSHPPAAVSAMDGYAVRAADVAQVPVTLKLIGESAAGGGFDGAVGEGQAVRIFTGAPAPEGADAIVMQEVTDSDGQTVTIKESSPEGKFIRPAGMDFATGEILLRAGTALTARQIGLAAAMNVPWLMVRRRPRIAILATGNEVVMPGDPLGPYQIISSNSLALAAYITVLGGEPVNLGIAGDDECSLRRRLEDAAGADLLVTIGGVSVGDYDLVHKVLGGEGPDGEGVGGEKMNLDFFKVAMRPGKPLIFGHLGPMPVLGLPGNPVSAGVTSVVFLRPAMETMLGMPPRDGPAPTAVLGRGLPRNDQRQDYLRSTLAHDQAGELIATPYGRQDSAMMARFADAHCLVVRPPHAEAAKAGERVEILPLARGTVSI